MPDLIDRDLALNMELSVECQPEELEPLMRGMNLVFQHIKELPAADVQPVRRGRWEHIESSTRSWRFRCSECGDISYYPVPKYHAHGCGYKFCPNCGARMDGDE